MEDVEEHRRVLRDLVSASGDISVLARELEGFQGWDVEPLVALGGPEVVAILERYLRGDLSAEDVGIWAESLEMRDDVEYGDGGENGVITAVFQLANQVVNRSLTPEIAREMVVELQALSAPERDTPMAPQPLTPERARAWESDGGKPSHRYPCPCCGYKTLPGRGDYDLCPVCWWEDEGVEPWEYSGPNAQTLVEAQQEYLAEARPYRHRPGKVRAPKRRESRDPDWRPLVLTEDLMARVQQANEEQRRYWEAKQRRDAQELADDPEGPFTEYNAAMESLMPQTPTMSHREVKTRIRDLGRDHDFTVPDAYLKLQSRLVKDEHFYRHHPFHAAWWLLRHARPGTYKQRWQELRSGTFYFAG